MSRRSGLQASQRKFYSGVTVSFCLGNTIVNVMLETQCSISRCVRETNLNLMFTEVVAHHVVSECNLSQGLFQDSPYSPSYINKHQCKLHPRKASTPSVPLPHDQGLVRAYSATHRLFFLAYLKEYLQTKAGHDTVPIFSIVIINSFKVINLDELQTIRQLD